ncbi:MAG TPA: septal ring lytic transglycosylase RlpA family protein [Thermoanaerobaculia bacterium]|nr:septal ring lytic transglycosylase RlpA family protein [Thermoanaerobaculia bacterium]
MRQRLRLAAALLCLAAACTSSRPPAGAPAAPPASAGTGSLLAEEGIASWYGGNDGFEGKPTASGEIYDSSLLTAAHRELPLGTIVDVACVENGKTVRVRINDRGPFIRGRIIDLSRAAAERLDLIGPGIGRVRLTVVKPGIEAPVVSVSGLWSVQIGSFADSRNANRQADRARATGRTVSLEPYNGLTRVKVGAYSSRDEAREVLASLEEAGFEGIVVPAK